MHSGNQITQLKTRESERQTLVENKLTFNGPASTLSVYDTYREAERVGLGAGELTYCGMVTGKKIMHSGVHHDGVEFLPHESYVMPPGEYVEIDFPEAKETRPTTCLTIEIAKERIEKVSEQMRRYSTLDCLDHDWEYQSKIVHNHHTEDTQRLLNNLVQLYTNNHPDKAIMVDLGVTELIVKLLRQQGREVLLSYCQKRPDATGMTAVLNYLSEQYTKPIELDELAKKACMSRSRFYTEFKKQLGCSPLEYLQQLRLQKSVQKLQKGASVTEACFTSGFQDLSHFSKRFRGFFGLTPSQCIMQSKK